MCIYIHKVAMRYEIKKVLNKSFWIFLAVALIVNIYFYYQTQESRYGYLFEDKEYVQWIEKLEKNPKLDLTEVTKTDENGLPLNTYGYNLKQQQDYVDLYKKYIEEMPERAESALIISKTDFAKRNVEKTLADFEKMKGREITIGIDAGVQSVYSFTLSDIIAVVLVLFAGIKLFSKEYNMKIFPLLLATRGRTRLAAGKILTLALTTFIICTSIYLTNVLVSEFAFGLGKLSRSIQSIEAFRSSSFLISCGEYLIFAYLIKLFTLLSIAIVVFLLFTLVKKETFVFLILVLIAGVEFLLYSTIPVTSSLNAFHFINIFHILDSMKIIGDYQNINLLSFPVSMTTVLPILWTVIIVASSAVIVMKFKTSAVAYGIKSPKWLQVVLNKLKRNIDKLNSHTSLTLHELRKVFILKKGLIFLLVMVIFLVNGYNSAFRMKSSESLSYDTYVEKFGGVVTEQTIKDIEDEEQRIAELQKNSEISFDANGQLKALSEIRMQAEKGLQLQQEKGIKPYIVNTQSFEKLFNDKDSTNKDVLVIVIFSILCVSSCISSESKIKNLLRICPNGKKLLRTKYIIGITTTLLITITVNIFRILTVIKDYKFDFFEAPIQNLMFLSQNELKITLMQYMIIKAIVQIIGAIILGSIICMISSKCKEDALSMTFSTALILSPILAYTSKIYIVKYISVIPLLSGDIFLQDNILSKVVYVILGVCALVLSVYVIDKSWKSGMNKSNR